MKFLLKKDLPFQKADDTEWEMMFGTEYLFNNSKLENGFVWVRSWGNPLTSGFFEPVEEKRWRAKKNGIYWLINSLSEIIDADDYFYSIDALRYTLGNYFRTEADAQLALDKYIKPALDAAHEALGY